MVKRTVGKVEVDFSNSTEALNKIKQLNDGVRTATLNVEKLKQSFEEAPRTINNFIKELNKVNDKGHIEGSVTSRQKQALDVRSNDLAKLIDDLSKVTGVNSAVDNASNKKVDESTLKSLNDSANRIIEMLSRTGVTSTIDRRNGTDIGVNDSMRNAYSQNVRDFNKRADYSTLKDIDPDTISGNIKLADSVIKEARGVLSNNNRTLNNIDSTKNSGNVTFNRNKQYENFFKSSNNRLSDTQDKIDSVSNTLDLTKDNLSSREEELRENIKNSSSSKEIQEYEKELQAIKSLKAKVENEIDKVSNMSGNISSAKSNLEGSEKDYNKSISDGNLKVGVDPQSFLGRLRAQSMNIAQRAMGTATAVAGSAITQGTSVRENAYNNGTGSIMMGLASQNVTGKKMDDTILQTLEKTGIHNGTHYSGSEMVQFADSYTSTNRYGSVKDYNKQADSISQMARYSGMDNNSANGLIKSAGISGVTDMTNFTKVVAGSLQNSNMNGRSSEMANALASILSNTANIGNMSQSQASSWASLQGMANATHNSAIQGQQGANALNAMTNGITNTNSAYARQVFAQASGNTGRYSGRDGAFNLSLDMEQARKDPTKLNPILKQLDQNSSGNANLMAAQLQSLSGGSLSATQSKDLVELYKKGDFSKSKVKKAMEKDSNAATHNNKGKEAYGSSGKSTLDFSIAVDEKGNVSISKATDHIRGLKAHVKNATGVVGGVAMDIFGNVAGNVLSSLIVGKGGIKGGLGQVAKWAGKTKLGGKVLEKVGKTKLGGKALQWLTKGAEGATEATEGGSGLLGIGKGLLTKGKGLLSKGLGLFGVEEGTGLMGLAKVGLKRLGPWAALISTLQFGNHEVGSKDSILNRITGNTGSTHFWGRNDKHNFFQKWGHNVQTVGNKLPKYLKWLGLGTDIVGGGIKGIGDIYDNLFGEGSKAHADSVRDIKKHSKRKHIEKSKSKYTKKQKALLRQFNEMLDKAEKVIALAKAGGSSSGGDDSSTGDASGGGHTGDQKYWEGKIREVAKAMGQDITDEQVAKISSMMKAESGYNETITQKIDDQNSRAGHPAQGILQYVPSTFDRFKVKGHENINSGIDQLYALFNDSNWQKDIHYGGGWGPSGTPVKHARGGLISRATMLGSNLVGEAGTELVLPMNALHGDDGRRLLGSLASNFGSTLVDNNLVNKATSKSEMNLSPTYSVNVTLNGTESDDDVRNSLQRELETTRSSLAEKLTNYYSQDLHTQYY